MAKEPEVLSVNVGESIKTAETVGGGGNKSPFQNPLHDPRVVGVAAARSVEDVIRLAPEAIRVSKEQNKPAIITVMGWLDPKG